MYFLGTQSLEHSKFTLRVVFANGSPRARPENLLRNRLMNFSGSKLPHPRPGWLLLDTSR